MKQIHFTVYGHPEPQGSTKAFIPKGWTRPVITADNKKTKPWRQQITGTAIDTPGMECWKREQGGIKINLIFVFTRPASLKKSWTLASKKPDLDKLQRSVFDALTDIAYEDDSQIVAAHSIKIYGDRERVEIGIDFVGHGE